MKKLLITLALIAITPIALGEPSITPIGVADTIGGGKLLLLSEKCATEGREYITTNAMNRIVDGGCWMVHKDKTRIVLLSSDMQIIYYPIDVFRTTDGSLKNNAPYN